MENTSWSVQCLGVAELGELEQLLSAHHLPIVDIRGPVVQLFAGYMGGELVGSIGVEQYGRVGLLRSLAVKPIYQGQKIGEKLIAFLTDHCLAENISELYLLTTTADRYFDRLGFQRITRADAPKEIVQTSEFKDICPASAVVMRKML